MPKVLTHEETSELLRNALKWIYARYNVTAPIRIDFRLGVEPSPLFLVENGMQVTRISTAPQKIEALIPALFHAVLHEIDYPNNPGASLRQLPQDHPLEDFHRKEAKADWELWYSQNQR